MPGFVRTEEDEKKWQKAKKIVQEQHGSIAWPLVTHIFNQMQKGEEITNPMADPEYKKKIDAIDVKIKRKKLEQIGVPTLPTKEEKVIKEEDQVEGAIDQSTQDHIDRILAPIKNLRMQLQAAKEQHIDAKKKLKQDTLRQTYGPINAKKPKASHLRVVKARKELDDLSKALKVLKDSIDILNKAEKDVDPATSFSQEETEKMKPWLDNGFNHHEAAHMTGVRSTPYSLKSTRKSNEMSDSMLEHAKTYAAKHVQKLKEMRGESAESHHNPVIFEHHQSGKATKDLAKDVNQYLNEFKSSGALEGMLPHQKAAAINKKMAEWHSLNKEQEKQKASETAKQLNEIHDQASASRQFELLQQRMHMLSGGSGTAESSGYEDLPEDVDYSQEDEDKI